MKKLFYSAVEMEYCNHNINCICCVQIHYPHVLFNVIFFQVYNLSICSLRYSGYDSNLILRIVVNFFFIFYFFRTDLLFFFFFFFFLFFSILIIISIYIVNDGALYEVEYLCMFQMLCSYVSFFLFRWP